MADMILVNSKFIASTFASTFKHLHARVIRLEVLYPAVNVDKFDAPPPPKLNFLSVNHFERKKNIDLAITAFARLNTLLQGHDLAGATLTTAGGYDKRLRENVVYLDELKTLAEKEGVSERVGFITSCSTSERNALLSECLCVLYTPTEEHLGIVPLEAMAAFRLVIACNSGGPTEAVKHGVIGFLCDPTPDEFAVAMAKLIQDTEMAKELGEQARQHVVESFSTKVFGQHLNRYILGVVAIEKSE